MRVSCPVLRGAEGEVPSVYSPDSMIIDCISYESTPTHSGLNQVLEWYEEFRPKTMYLTNMSHRIDFFDIQKQIPHNMKPLYEGQIIKLI